MALITLWVIFSIAATTFIRAGDEYKDYSDYWLVKVQPENDAQRTVLEQLENEVAASDDEVIFLALKSFRLLISLWQLNYATQTRTLLLFTRLPLNYFSHTGVARKSPLLGEFAQRIRPFGRPGVSRPANDVSL